MFKANTARSYSRVRRGGLCVCNIDAGCSHSVKADGQCYPDVRFLMWRWHHHHHHHHVVAALSIHAEAKFQWSTVFMYTCMWTTAYVFCHLCSMTGFTNFNIVYIVAAQSLCQYTFLPRGIGAEFLMDKRTLKMIPATDGSKQKKKWLLFCRRRSVTNTFFSISLSFLSTNLSCELCHNGLNLKASVLFGMTVSGLYIEIHWWPQTHAIRTHTRWKVNLRGYPRCRQPEINNSEYTPLNSPCSASDSLSISLPPEKRSEEEEEQASQSHPRHLRLRHPPHPCWTLPSPPCFHR